MMEEMNYGWSPWINPLFRSEGINESSTRWSYNLMVWGFASLLILFIIVINIYPIGGNSNYVPYSNTDISPQGTSIELPTITEVIEETSTIKLKVKFVSGLIIRIVLVLGGFFLFSLFSGWIMNEMAIRFKLLKIFGVFKSSSLVDINL